MSACRYSETLVPDVWFDTKAVWEVKCADFSISPRHKAAIGLVDAEKGISIRFPRLVRVRDDKAPEDATSAEQVGSACKSEESVAPRIPQEPSSSWLPCSDVSLQSVAMFMSTQRAVNWWPYQLQPVCLKECKLAQGIEPLGF